MGHPCWISGPIGARTKLGDLKQVPPLEKPRGHLVAIWFDLGCTKKGDLKPSWAPDGYQIR